MKKFLLTSVAALSLAAALTFDVSAQQSTMIPAESEEAAYAWAEATFPGFVIAVVDNGDGTYTITITEPAVVTPGDDDVTPGDDDVTPGDDDVTPGDDDVTPGDDDVTPGDDEDDVPTPTPSTSTSVDDALEQVDQGLQDPNRPWNPEDGTLDDVNEDVAGIEDTEIPLENVFPSYEAAQTAAERYVGRNPQYRYTIAETASGFAVQYVAKTASVRPLEQARFEGFSFDTYEEAVAFGRGLQNRFNNLGFDVVVNSADGFSVRLFNEEYTPAPEADVLTFVKVTDARNHAEANVKPGQFYEIIQTADGSFAVRYYSKVAIRPAELSTLEDARFDSEAAAKEVANEYKRVFAGLETRIILDADGNYRIEVLDYMTEEEVANQLPIDENDGTITEDVEGSKPGSGDNNDDEDHKGHKPGRPGKGTKPGRPGKGTKPGSGSKTPAGSNAAGSELPETGESSAYAIYGAAALSVLAGLGLIAKKREEA